MLAERRRRAILDEVMKAGEVKIQELAHCFSVSPMTIRRDLESLAADGLLQRTHGGAVSPEGSWIEPSAVVKREIHAYEKEQIAQQALRFIKPGMSVILDAGSTTLTLAQRLPDIGRLRVVTSDIEIAKFLSDCTDIEVFITGGLVKAGIYSVDGEFAIEMLSSIQVDVAFVGCDSFTGDWAMSRTVNKSALKRAMMNAAAKKLLLADSSKYGHTTFHKIAALDEYDAIITDSAFPCADMDQLRQHGVHVTVRSEPDQPTQASHSVV